MMTLPGLQIAAWAFLAFWFWVAFAAWLKKTGIVAPYAILIAAILGWVGAGLLLRWLVPGFGHWPMSWLDRTAFLSMR